MTDCLNDWINVNNVTILFSLWTYTAASMSSSWKMRDTIYVHWFAWLTSQSESSPPTLIRNSQSVNWVLIRADLKVQATIGLGCYCITLGSHPDFQFHHIQLSVFLFFFYREKRRKDDWLEGCYSIWLGFMSRFPSSPLSHGYHQHLHTLHDQEWLSVKTEPTHLSDLKLWICQHGQ